MIFMFDTDSREIPAVSYSEREMADESNLPALIDFCRAMAQFYVEFAWYLDCPDKNIRAAWDVFSDIIGRNVDSIVEDFLEEDDRVASEEPSPDDSGKNNAAAPMSTT
ncbi:MAG: hypothetical protein LUF29_02480 [Oscillospiraceae bacterium]|nr:hypothetical protein [Oscillospiraceae bacterium]